MREAPHALGGRIGDRTAPRCPACRQSMTARLDDPTRDRLRLVGMIRWCVSCSALSRVEVGTIADDEGKPVEVWRVEEL